MKLKPSICLATALSLAAAPVPATAQSPAEIASAEAALNLFQRFALQYVILFARTTIELTYDSLSVDSRNQETVIGGLVLRPKLDWDPDRLCEIHIDRLAGFGSGEIALIRSILELTDVTAGTACFDPGTGAMLASFGYDELTIDRVSMTIAYDLPSSGAQVEMTADIADAAEITVNADFDYVFLEQPNLGFQMQDEDDFDEFGAGLEPVARLATAEIVVSNEGIWERVSPMLNAQLGDVRQLPDMIGPMLGQMLVAPGQALGAEEQALIENLRAELARFVENGDRLVINVAPEGGLWLTEEIFASPQAAIAALKPRLSAAPLAADLILPADILSAALAGGDGLDDDARLAAGTALVRGIGAPRAMTEGVALVRPLADRWNGAAAALVAEAMTIAGDSRGAYAMALRAMAGDADGAIGIADGLEGALSIEDVVATQAEALAAWPGAGAWDSRKSDALAAGHVAELRRLAYAAHAGRAAPRSYAEAYFLASLAAAAGDPGAALLRDRIDARFTAPDGSREPAWNAAASAAATAALEAWTTGGLAARVTAAYGR